MQALYKKVSGYDEIFGILPVVEKHGNQKYSYQYI